MNLAQARHIIANQGCTPMADWMLAGQVLWQHYQNNPQLLKPIDDAKPQSEGAGRTSINDAMPRAMVDRLPPGARLIQRLPLDASGYFISLDPQTGAAALYYYDPPKQDPGMVVGASGVEQNTFDRGPAYYTRLARQAHTARELAGVRLKSINAANREAWGKRNG